MLVSYRLNMMQRRSSMKMRKKMKRKPTVANVAATGPRKVERRDEDPAMRPLSTAWTCKTIWTLR